MGTSIALSLLIGQAVQLYTSQKRSSSDEWQHNWGHAANQPLLWHDATAGPFATPSKVAVVHKRPPIHLQLLVCLAL